MIATFDQQLQVNSIACYQSSGQWLIFVGRRDGSISVYGSGDKEPRTLLHQHKSNG